MGGLGSHVEHKLNAHAPNTTGQIPWRTDSISFASSSAAISIHYEMMDKIAWQKRYI